MENRSYGITIARAALTLILSGPLFAANLSAPFTLETSQVLPSGVRNPRFLNVITNIDTKFDEDGGLEPLGNRLNKRVTWQDVVDAQSDDAQKNLVRSVLDDTGLSLSAGSPGDATGVVNTYANIKVPVLAWGVSEKLTLGLAVPIVTVDVSVDTGFVRGDEGKVFVDYLCDTSPDKCNEAALKLNSATSQKLSRLGYEPLQSHTISGVGDLQLMGRYRWFGDARQGLATKLTVVLPTGTDPNPDRALDITTGDDRYKVAVAVVYDRYFWGEARWNVHGGYTALMPNRQLKRLPTSADDSLSDDKEFLTRRYGDQVILGTGVEYPVQSLGLVLGAGYSAQYLGKTRYEGGAADEATRHRYRLLEDLEPSQVLHAVTATVGFSTVSWYRRGEFPLPFQASLVYSHPVGGRNAPRNDIVAGEMVLFF